MRSLSDAPESGRKTTLSPGAILALAHNLVSGLESLSGISWKTGAGLDPDRGGPKNKASGAFTAPGALF